MRPPSSYGSMKSDSDGEEQGDTETSVPVFPAALEEPNILTDMGYSVILLITFILSFLTHFF